MMATRLVTTDLGAAAEAAAKIPRAVFRLDQAMRLAQENLQDAKEPEVPVEHVLLFIGRMTSAQVQVQEARAELILLLSQTGVPVRQIADAFGIHHSSVTKAIKAAQSHAAMTTAVATEDAAVEAARLRDEEFRKRQEQNPQQVAR